MAYANLLNCIGIKAQAAVSDKLNKETAYAYDKLGITAPETVSNAEGKQFVLVDHSSYSQAIDGMDAAKVVGIVDHHGIGDVTVSELINVRSAPAGATASLVYLAYRECEVEVFISYYLRENQKICIPMPFTGNIIQMVIYSLGKAETCFPLENGGKVC